MARTVATTRTAVANRLLVRPMNYSLGFNGTSTVITKNSQTAYNLSNFSISFWVKRLVTTVGSTLELYSEGWTGGNNPVYVLRSDPASPGKNRHLFMLVRDDAGTTQVNNSQFSLDVLDGKWHKVVLTDAAGTCRLYVDAVLDPTTISYTRGTLTLDRTAFGALVRATTVNFFQGNLKECRVFNKVLSATEVASLYWRGTVPSGCIVEYLLDDGSGTTATDTSGQGSDGTITGPVWSTDTPIKTRTVAGARSAA